MDSLATKCHSIEDVGTNLACGTFKTEGRVVVPCSIKTVPLMWSSKSAANLCLPFGSFLSVPFTSTSRCYSGCVPMKILPKLSQSAVERVIGREVAGGRNVVVTQSAIFALRAALSHS